LAFGSSSSANFFSNFSQSNICQRQGQPKQPDLEALLSLGGMTVQFVPSGETAQRIAEDWVVSI